WVPTSKTPMQTASKIPAGSFVTNGGFSVTVSPMVSGSPQDGRDLPREHEMVLGPRRRDVGQVLLLLVRGGPGLRPLAAEQLGSQQDDPIGLGPLGPMDG